MILAGAEPSATEAHRWRLCEPASLDLSRARWVVAKTLTTFQTREFQRLVRENWR